VEDAAAALAWVITNISNYGGDPQKIYVSGHSAGGYLACMLAMDKKYLAKYDLTPKSVAAYAPLSGHTITHFTVRKEMGLGKLDMHIGEMAPLAHIRKDTPKILLITGDREKEMLGRYEENAYFWRMMRVAGNKNIDLIEIKGTDHGTMVKPALDKVIDFINKN
jgi:acetyl esterase/lipase